MSLQNLLQNERKKWAVLRIEDLVLDGEVNFVNGSLFSFSQVTLPCTFYGPSGSLAVDIIGYKIGNLRILIIPPILITPAGAASGTFYTSNLPTDFQIPAIVPPCGVLSVCQVKINSTTWQTGYLTVKEQTINLGIGVGTTGPGSVIGFTVVGSGSANEYGLQSPATLVYHV